MKTYIVYVDGRETGYIKAGSHNAAEKKAKDKYGSVNHSEVESYLKLHPGLTRGQVLNRLINNVSVAYTEL